MNACCLMLCVMVQAAAAEEPFSIGNRRQLLFDEKFVHQAKGIEFHVHPPRKTGEQILVSEPPWSLGGYHSVLKHGNRYHLWYTAGGCILYARSHDGVDWERPNLGLVSAETRQAAASASNVVMGMGAGGVKAAAHGVMVFLDPRAPDSERLRLVANTQEYNRRVQLFSSPDGIHWRLTHRDVITYRDSRHHLDSQNVIFWDDRLAKYVAYFRRNLREAGSQSRSVARAESADLLRFPQVEDSPVVLRADTEHPGHTAPGGKRTISVVDVYTNGTIKYPWADDTYLMFPTEYYHYGAYHEPFREEWPVNAGALDTRFAASRDGVHWNRYDRRSFIGLGMQGEFDSKRVYVAYGVVPAQNDRELYMYYLGTSETHGWNRDDRNNRLLKAAGLAPTGPSVLSRVVLRRDGFVSVRAAYAGGEFVTPLLRFQGEQLMVNVDTSASGELRVEIQDDSGQPVPGYALSDCDLVHTANEISRAITWKGRSEVGSLAGKPIRLRFVMRDVDLYAFQFSDRGGI